MSENLYPLYIIVLLGMLWFLYIYRKDVFEPEPKYKIFKAVMWGAVPAVILSYFFGSIFFWIGLLAAPIIEESFKGIYIYKLRNDNEFEGPMDGLVYGAAVGIGFEIVENILYSYFLDGIDIQLSILRSVVIGHALFTGFLGLMIGLAKIKSKTSYIFYGYVGAVLMHLAWNGLTDISMIFYFILILVFILILKKSINIALKYEFDVYLSPREEFEDRARRFIIENNGATTAELAEELGIKPHRTALFMKSINSKFYKDRKKWLLLNID
jgi:RsiW-degrading membrane proteinase PrsW (M82 family)